MAIRAFPRKLILTLHIATSLAWAGALAVFLAHALASLAADDVQVVRALSIAMAVTAWLVILPLCLASLGTGIAQALGTAWGLLRHYWVAFKLALTAVATAVLLLKLGPISDLARQAMDFSSAGDAQGLRRSLAFHAAGGLAFLLAATALAVYKPAGLTRPVPSPSGEVDDLVRPRWVRVALWVGAVVCAALVAMLLAGGHGPGAHPG